MFQLQMMYGVLYDAGKIVKRASVLLFIVAFIFSNNAHCQFVEMAASNSIYATSINPFHGNGCSFMDFNDDGWDDLTIARKFSAPLFFKNVNGNYVPYYPTFSPAISNSMDGKMPLWFDYDNDGDKDFLYTELFNGVQLYRNDGNNIFNEVTLQAGLVIGYGRCMGASVGDYNKDGFLDLFICKFHNYLIDFGVNYANQFFRNNGNGTFTDVTIESGIGQSIQASFMSIFSDFNHDGWQDLYIVNDKIVQGNYLYLNNGNNTFSNVSETSGAGVHMDAMTGTIDDFDNDNDLDIFVSNTYAENALLKNDGDAHFTDISVDAGLNVYNPNLETWGAMWLDYDNDKLQDLFVSTSGVFVNAAVPNQFYKNNGDGTFIEVTNEVGIGLNYASSYTCAMGDVNNDGYYDFFSSNASPSYSELWVNTYDGNNFLSVELEGTTSNKDGIGTYIDIWCNGEQFTRYTHGGESYMAQNSGKEIFGLANVEVIDSLRLQWQSGLTEYYYRIPANQHLHLIEGNASEVLISVQGDIPMCAGDSIQLSVGEWHEIAWSDSTLSNEPAIYTPGSYWAAITDDQGNVFLSDTLTVQLHTMPVVNVTMQSPVCNGDANGSISIENVSITGDQINWNGEIVEGNTLTGLTSGLYEYVFLDSNLCQVSGEILLTEPEILTAAIQATAPSCFDSNDGTVEIFPTGGQPNYSMNWMGENPQQLSSGEYTMGLTDAAGCSIFINYEVLTVDSIQADIITQDVDCHGESSGTVQITATGGTGILSYSINYPNPDQLPAGDYTLQVLDENNCMSEVDFTIYEPEPLSTTIATNPEFEGGPLGSAQLTIEGGVSPYSIAWNGNTTNAVLQEDMVSGNYDVEITDANGCSFSDNFFIDFINGISFISKDELSMYPNPNHGDFWIEWKGEDQPERLEILDATGKVLMTQSKMKSPERISFEGHPSGHYKINIYTANLVRTFNFIVE